MAELTNGNTVRKKSVYTAVLFFFWQATALVAMVYLVLPWSVIVPVLLSIGFGTAILWLWGVHYKLLQNDAEDRVLEAIRQLDIAQIEANRDPLTGLHSRSYIHERLDEAMAVAIERHCFCAVLLMDLDFFKDINEALGHQLGNQLLSAIGERLQTVVKQGDLLGYYGADEFIVLLPAIKDEMAPEIVARRLLTSLSEPFSVHGHTLSISASLGVSIGPQDGTEGETLIRRAESALAQSKSQGRKGYQFFTRSMNRSAAKRLRVDQQLRWALRRGEFSLVYQPIVDTRSHTLAGAEALIRWNNPELGQVSPADFITIAEQIGIIADIGDWVLNEAVAQVSAWQRLYQTRLVMSVNVSPRQFHDGNIVSKAKSAISRLDLDPGCLQLEVTEGLLMNASQSLVRDLTLLNRAGVHLALDDFGTGYSSLSYLRHLPFDVLKIDQSFIHEVSRNSQDEALVEAMVHMGHSLGMKVVAEGIETPEQTSRLSQLQVDSLQGFYFSHPIPSRTFEHLYLDGSRGERLKLDKSVWGRD